MPQPQVSCWLAGLPLAAAFGHPSNLAARSSSLSRGTSPAAAGSSAVAVPLQAQRSSRLAMLSLHWRSLFLPVHQLSLRLRMRAGAAPAGAAAKGSAVIAAAFCAASAKLACHDTFWQVLYPGGIAGVVVT